MPISLMLALACIASGCSITHASVGLDSDAVAAVAPSDGSGLEPVEAATSAVGSNDAGSSAIDESDDQDQELLTVEAEQAADQGQPIRRDPNDQVEDVDDRPAALAFASWAGPVDNPIQLMKRLGGTGVDGVIEQGERLAAMATVSADCLGIVPTPKSTSYRREHWAHNPNVIVSMYAHDDATSAAAFAADLPAATGACADDMPGSQTTYETVDPGEFDVTDDRFRAWDAWNGDDGVRVFTTHHGQLSALITVEIRQAQGSREFFEANRALIQIAMVLDHPTLDIPETGRWNSPIEAEEFFVGSFHTRGITYSPEEVACVATELDNQTRLGSILSDGVALDHLGVWCAPNVSARFHAELSDDTAIAISDPVQRLCFAKLTTTYRTRGTFEDYLDRVANPTKMDPHSIERAVLDAALLDQCGLSGTEGVVAGLEARDPLDD